MKKKILLFSSTILILILSGTNNAVSAQSALWTNKLNGAGDNSDRYNEAIADGLGNFYLTGYTVNPGTGKDFLTVKLNSSGDTVWTRKYNHISNLDDEANYLALDGAGNIIVTGSSDDGSASTKTDFLTIKYSSAGTMLWAVRYNYALANEDEFPTGIAVDASDNIFITGRSDHDAGNVDDFATVKYNSSGVEQWVARYDGGGTDRTVGVVPANAGGCAITGRTFNGLNDDIITISYSSTATTLWTASFAGAAGGDDRPEQIMTDASGNIYVAATRENASNDDYITFKYSSTGVLLWSPFYNSSQSDKIIAMTLDASGNVYVTGQSDIDLGGSADYDFRTVKYNSSGVQQWVVATGNPAAQDDIPAAINIDAAGNVYVTGKSDAASGGTLNYEFMTAKYNSSGVQQWVKFYDGTTANGEDIPASVLIDASSNVWVAGSVDFTATQKDATFLKYNSTGVLQATKTFNGAGDFNDKANAIATDATNNTYITGYTMNAGKQRDILIQKINSSGVTQWTRTFDGTGENDEGLAITTDALGNVYVTGYSNGSGTYNDYITLKFNAAGVLQWSAIYNYAANQLDKAVSIFVSAAGDVYVTGYSDGDASNLITNYDYATLKYNATGLLQWASRFNGTGNGSDKAAKLMMIGNSLYVTGTSFNGINNDITTLKYDIFGTQTGTVTYNGSSNGNEEAEDLTVNGNNIYVTGSSFVTGNSDDYVTIKYDTVLVQKWKANYNGTGDLNDHAYGVSATSTNVYVTGASIGTSLANDIALIRYNASTGAQNWAKRYTAPGAFNDEAYSVVTDATDNIYTTGKSGNATSVSDFISLNYNTTGTKLLTLKYNGTGNNEDVAKKAILDNNGYLYITGYSTGSGKNNFDFTTIKYCTPLPAATATALGATTICIGDSVTLSANTGAGLTYQWKKGNANIAGATSSTYKASSTGTYKVVVANSNGCTKTSNTISVSAIICRENEYDINAFHAGISPNPFSEQAIVQLNGNQSTDATIEVYDITGQRVLSEFIEAGTNSFGFGTDLPAGNYTVVITTDKDYEVMKVIKTN